MITGRIYRPVGVRYVEVTDEEGRQLVVVAAGGWWHANPSSSLITAPETPRLTSNWILRAPAFNGGSLNFTKPQGAGLLTETFTSPISSTSMDSFSIRLVRSSMQTTYGTVFEASPPILLVL